MLPGITSESIDQVISQEPAEAVLSTLNDSDNEEEMHEEESLQNKHVPHQAHDAKGMAVHFTHQNWELVVNIGIEPATEAPYPMIPIRMATHMEISTHTVAIRRESTSFFSSSIAMKRRRIWGIPK